MKTLVNRQSKNNVFVKYVDNDFYGISNEIPNTVLKSLSLKAKSIPQPLWYGKFINNEHYMQTLDLILSSTMETKHREIFFSKEVSPRIHNKNTLLDIGPGTGELSVSMAMLFNNITLVDVNDIALTRTEENILRSKPSATITKIHQSILETNLQKNHYDMIMISHMLYYIDPLRWMEIINLCYSALKTKGLMAIVLSGASHGKAKLMQHFSGKSVDIDYFIQSCADKFSCPIEVFRTREYFYACDIETMLHITGFLLYDINTHATRDKLARYIVKNHQINKHFFKISTEQEFILIEKK